MQEIPRRRIPRADRLCPMSTAVAVKPGWKYPRVIKHQQVVRTQQARNIPKLAVQQPSSSPIEV
jgi:hypothetical protein